MTNALLIKRMPKWKLTNYYLISYGKQCWGIISFDLGTLSDLSTLWHFTICPVTTSKKYASIYAYMACVGCVYQHEFVRCSVTCTNITFLFVCLCLYLNIVLSGNLGTVWFYELILFIDIEYSPLMFFSKKLEENYRGLGVNLENIWWVSFTWVKVMGDNQNAEFLKHVLTA